MEKKDRPLPQPAQRPFGGPRRGEPGEAQPLMADALAMAAAEGRLDEFMQREMPDNEYARNLASMMMGMTGMAPPAPACAAPPAGGEESRGEGAAPQPPEDLLRAAGAGDVAALTELLKKEHEKRGGSPAADAAPPRQEPGPAAAEQEVLDGLVAIAAENGLTVDWVVLRALKLYAEEYRRTGRL